MLGRDADPYPPASIRLDAVLVFFASFVLYSLLAQEKNYGDGNFLLGFYHEGARVHPVHILYFPALSLLRSLLEPMGFSLFEIASFFSAAGTAVGIAFGHLALGCMGHSRRESLLASSALALCPAVLFFATVVELHGPFFTFVGLSFYLLARLQRSPGELNALLLGLASGASYYAHASGFIFVGLLILSWLGLSSREQCCSRRQLVLTSIVLAGHFALIYGGATLLSSMGLVVGVEEASGYVRSLEVLGDADWSWGLRTLWEEWLYAFMPLSIISLAAVLTLPGRRMTLAILPALLAYLLAALILVGDQDERGAYLLPLAFSALLTVLLSKPCWRQRLLIASILLGAAVGVTRVWLHDDGSRSLAEAQEFRETVSDAPAYLLTGTESDIETCMLRLPDQAFRHLARYAGLQPEELAEQLPTIDTSIDALLAAGTAIYLTRGAATYLETAGDQNRSGPELMAHLRRRFTLEVLPSRRFLGYRLMPK